MTEIVEQATQALIAAIRDVRSRRKPLRAKESAQVLGTAREAARLINETACLIRDIDERIAKSRLSPYGQRQRDDALKVLNRYQAGREADVRSIADRCMATVHAAKTDHEVQTAINNIGAMLEDAGLKRIEALRQAGPPPQQWGWDEPMTADEFGWAITEMLKENSRYVRNLNPIGLSYVPFHGWDERRVWGHVRTRRKREEARARRKEQREASRPFSPEEIKRAKAELFKAHPDHGGTDAAFREAHKRYEKAKRKGRR